MKSTQETRSQKMDELLNKMAKHFNEAFPTTVDFAKWFAHAYGLLSENKGGRHEESAKGLLWSFGNDLLPNLIEAKNKKEKAEIIIKGFREAAGGNQISKGLLYLNYLTFDDMQDCKGSPEDWNKIERTAKNLGLIAKLGAEYEDMSYEIMV